MNLDQTIPKAMLSKSNLVLWTLRLHQRYNDKIRTLKCIYNGVESATVDLEVKKIEIQRQLSKLHDEVEKLRFERPIDYVEWKQNFFMSMQQMRQKFKAWKFRVYPTE
jgi:hypothetical protein